MKHCRLSRMLRGGVFICIALLCFSCNNFMNAGKVKTEIEEAIEIANSSAITYYVTAPKDSGKVNPVYVNLKKKESTLIMFEPADEWKFICWEAIDRDSGEVINDVVKFEDPFKLETKATILQPRENVAINAKSIQLPMIVSVSPSYSERPYASTPIYITFNIPMENEENPAASTTFIYGPQNISISSNGNDMTGFFDAPVFVDSDKKILALLPHGEELSKEIEEKNLTSFTISFGSEIEYKNGGETFPLVQNENSSFVVRYIKNLDEEPPVPVQGQFFVTRKHITLEDAVNLPVEDRFSQGSSDNEIIKNRTNGTIYIYGNFYDADSGVRLVTVKEKLVDSPTISNNIQQETYTHYYTDFSENVEFKRTTKNNLSFCIKTNLQSGDGMVVLEITVEDTAGKKYIQSFDVPKKSKLSLDDESIILRNGLNLTNGNIIDSTYKEELKKLNLGFGYGDSIAMWYIYPVHLPSKDIIKEYTIKCTYSGKTDEFKYTDNEAEYGYLFDRANSGWNLTLDVDTVSGLPFTIEIWDDMGNYAKKDFVFPESSSVCAYCNDNKAYFVSGQNKSTITKGFYMATNSSDPSDKSSGSFEDCNYFSMQNNYNYQIVPCIKDLESNEYYVEMPENLIVNTTSSGNTVSDVVLLKNIVDTEHPYKIEKIVRNDANSNNGGFLLITVSIDESNWQNFDSIYLEHEENKFFSFDYGTTQASFIEETAVFYNYGNGGDYIINVYGIKNDLKSTPTPCTITDPLKNPDYDNLKPYAATIHPGGDHTFAPYDWDKMLLAVVDFQSGAAESYFTVKGLNKTFTATAVDNSFFPSWLVEQYNKHTINHPTSYYNSVSEYFIRHNIGTDIYFVTIPIITTKYEKSKYSYSGTYNDKAGNSSYVNDLTLHDGTWYSTKNVKVIGIEKVPDSSNEYQMKLSLPAQHGLGGFVKVDKLTKNQKKWGWIEDSKKTFYKKNASYSGGKLDYAYTIEGDNVKGFTYTIKKEETSFSLPTDSFVRVILHDDDYSSRTEPCYYYTGTPSTPNASFIEPRSNTSIIVNSDQPVFVHTLATNYSYEECKDWPIDEWEFFKYEVGVEQLDISSACQRMIYNIPVNEIDSGNCYVAVVHFADGTTEKSDVFVR